MKAIHTADTVNAKFLGPNSKLYPFKYVEITEKYKLLKTVTLLMYLSYRRYLEFNFPVLIRQNLDNFLLMDFNHFSILILNTFYFIFENLRIKNHSKLSSRHCLWVEFYKNENFHKK